MKKVLFVVDERKMGGVSIVLEDILNNISLKDKKVTLLILHNNGNRLVNIPKAIEVIYGSKFFEVVDSTMKEIKNNHDIKMFIKKLYLSFLMKTGLIKNKIIKERKKILKEHYDVEIAFKHGFTTLFMYYGNSTKKINWVHIDCELDDPAKHYYKLFKKIIPNIDNNVILCDSLKQSFYNIYKCDNMVVINNIIDIEKIKSKTQNVLKNNDGIKFVTVGRLCNQKSYDRLIEAFKLLKDDNLLVNVKLEMYGNGEDKNNIINLIKEYNLDDTIILKGFTDNPYAVMKNGNMYILSSLYEGYPLVIIESLLSGTPVLTTDVKSVNEMITNNGLVVDNSIDGLYDGLKTIILNKKLIKEYTDNLEKYTYDNDKIIKKIENLING